MVCPNYHNLWHLKFAVVLIFFMCISFKHVWNFGKRMKRKCKLRYILSFFKHCWFKKYVFSQFLPVLGQLFFSRASPLWLVKVGRSAFPFVQKTGGLLLFIDKLLNRFYNILQYFNFAVELKKYLVIFSCSTTGSSVLDEEGWLPYGRDPLPSGGGISFHGGEGGVESVPKFQCMCKSRFTY